MPALHASDFEAFVCDNPRCGARIAIPPGADMTIAEWQHSPEAESWFAEHREHAGCTGISVVPNARRRIEQLDPDQVALTMVEDLSSIDDSEYWQAQPAARRKAAKQVQLARLIAELKTYLIGSAAT